MTVGDLIYKLSKYDKSKRVVFSEYVLKSIEGYNCYCPEPRDIAMVDDALHEDCVTLILDSVELE